MPLKIAHLVVAVLAIIATLGTCCLDLVQGGSSFEHAFELMWERRYEIALYVLVIATVVYSRVRSLHKPDE